MTGVSTDAPISAELFARAQRVTPGGVNSPVRAFHAVGGTPRFMVSGTGAYLTDADGRQYVDLVSSWGPMILGHAHPAVVAAAQAAAAGGLSFGAPTIGEVELAETIVERVASPSLQQVRLVNSGTEATMSAIRLARGVTGRHRVVKFAGCYHGHSDALLAGGGSGVATLGLPDSAGVPASAVAETLVVPYNQVPEVGTDVACVIVEPVAANMGLVAPEPHFLEGLRHVCDRSGALLVFDEVITAFGRLGEWFGSERVGAEPDLITTAKGLTSAYAPMGAVVVSDRVAAPLYDEGRGFLHGVTFGGHPVCAAMA
ncbi:MAG: aminotransferase class III-fold pyridoxal phosphate-dependent enzyme, partial [Acidimicrobiales bacterium]